MEEKLPQIERAGIAENEAQAFEAFLRTLRDRKRVSHMAEGLVKLVMILSVTCFVLVITNAVTLWFAVHPDRQYFATDNGKIIPLVPTSEPYQSASTVIQFARDSVLQSFSLDFRNYEAQLELAREHFTPKAFAAFLKSMKESGVFRTAIEKQLVMSITADTGVLTKEGVSVNGRYAWIVEFPIEIVLSGGSYKLVPQRFLATVRIERIPTSESPSGIAIAQIVTVPM